MGNPDPDVLIVGAGPAGATTAARLARAGLRVLLLDKARFPREKACAEYASPMIEPLLREIGAPPIGDVPGTRPLRGMMVNAPDGTRHLFEYRQNGRGVPAFGVRRWSFDETLLQLAARAGAAVEQGTRVEWVGAPERGLVPVAIHHGGRQTSYRARIVVGADGLSSSVCRSRGWMRPVRWPRRLGLVAHYTDARPAGDYGELFVGRGGYCGIAPLGDGLTVVAGVTSLAAGRAVPAGQLFDGLVAEHPDLGAQLGGARRVGTLRGIGPIARRTARVSGDQALLVGDAAGFFDPFTGEGIYRALATGRLAAEVVQAAFAAGDFSDAQLARYDRGRHGLLAAKQRAGVLIQWFVMHPALLSLGLRRLGARPAVSERLGQVLGDLLPASDRLTLGLVGQLFLG